jgi:hypothetical protein
MATRIGSYEVLGLVGDGGMGTVYRARDPRFDRQVAIKVLHAHFRRDPGIVERFKSEAVIEAKLSHPHIVTVLDFIADETTLAMVMEYVEGQPLSAVIEAARGPLPADRTVRIMDQVLLAMAYAHERGLVHRDLKPSNVLVQRLGRQEYAKVMDFGIAKILGSEKLQTATGAKMGTLAYMSPEHVRSPKNVDARSDLYSLGITLFEALAGQVPFDADTEYELMRQIVETPVPPVRSLNASLPPAFESVVARATAKDPGHRYQSASEFRDALRAAADRSGGTVVAEVGAPLAPERPAPDVPGSPRPAASAGEALALQGRVAGAVAWFFWIAATTLVSQVTAILGSDVVFPLGFSLAPVLGGVVSAGGSDVGLTGLWLSLLGGGVLVALPLSMGLLARRGLSWPFVALSLPYALDALLLLAVGAWLGVGLHALALWFILRGYAARRQLLDLQRTEAGGGFAPAPTVAAGTCRQCRGAGRVYRTGRLGAQVCDTCAGLGHVSVAG